MSDSTETALVEFLRRETGEHLDFVVKYTPETWEPLFLGGGAEAAVSDVDTDVDAILDTFRSESISLSELNRGLRLGGYYCSLHLFEETVILHFSHPGRDGILFGYDPAAASHLTGFVTDVLPHVREAGVTDVATDPSWSG